MMHSCNHTIIWSLWLIISLSNFRLIFASPPRRLCAQDQMDALLEFKSEFYVQGFHLYGEAVDKKTERWTNNTYCCFWPGVSCDPKTGNVLELDLWDSFLNGPLRDNSSLFRLVHLQSLDLGSNNISGIIPDSIGNFKHLSFLCLASCNFFGKIPSSLGNLSYLTELIFFYDGISGDLPDSMGNLNRLTDFLLVDTKVGGNFPHMLLNLSELTYLELGSNQFEGRLPSNMSMLSKLDFFDIGGNSFSGSIPSSLFMMPSLVRLKLHRNHFSGPIEIGNMSSTSQLGSLDVGENNFNGPLPGSVSKLVGLWFLDLSHWNTGRGIADFSIFLHLKSLKHLHLSYLNTRSLVDLSLFSHLKSLDLLDLSGNSVTISSSLQFPSPMRTLALSSCNISVFPEFLQTKTDLLYLDISANQMEGQVPEWLWRLPRLRYVNISQNSFSSFEGSADVIQRSFKVMLDISSNAFKDRFPLLPASMFFFSGSSNQFSGEIPSTICDLVELDTLVLSNNNFSGPIPRCFGKFKYTLYILHLQNNSLSGSVPDEFMGHRLRYLDVGQNQLSGELPKSLINCTGLEFLNVESNRINDTFPFWLTSLPDLQILVLRSNEFHGSISSPEGSLSFPKLRIFDISENYFTGVLPSDYFASWSAMSTVVHIVDKTPVRFAGRGSNYYHNSVGLTNKGLDMELVGSSFTIYKTIDVSRNKLQGDIPESIGLLRELIVLNMSSNAFTGHIPPSLTNLTNLQSLDLSRNRLSGKIPPDLGKLTFLAWMNFSYNRLEGPIPQGTQIQSQNTSSFAENPGLCGVPLQKTCGRKEATKQEKDEDEDEEDTEVFSWTAAAIAYVPGVVCGLIIGHILMTYKLDWFMRIFRHLGL